jgi:Zn-dependent protease with chaperone function
VFSLIIVGLANAAPVVLLPLFYRVKPLDREALRKRLMALAERSGARVLGAYEWGLADKTKKANAALAGLGATRRILVSDTMLADYSDEEIEIVLAHELAHHVHGDIWKGSPSRARWSSAGFSSPRGCWTRQSGRRWRARRPRGASAAALAAGAVRS